jgi:hypothetical protein
METKEKEASMKASRYFRSAAFGAALILAQAAHATDFQQTWLHGNVCTGGGIVPSAYGPYNPSTTSSATVTCPITSVWSYQYPADTRIILVTAYNRNTTAGAFTCRAYGLDETGTLVWNPGTVVFNAGSLGEGVTGYSLGQPPANAKYFTATCNVPPNSAGTGNGYSHIIRFFIGVGS